MIVEQKKWNALSEDYSLDGDGMIENLRITNSKGDRFYFNESHRMISGLNLSGLLAMVNRSESNSPGSRYQSTRLEERDFDIEFRIMRNNFDETMMDDKRGSMYKVFNPSHNPMRVEFEMSNGKGYYLNAELASAPIMPPDKTNNNAVWQSVLLQFIATDPFIYSAESVRADIALWVPAFEFPLEIPEEGIEMGYRSPSLIVNVNNDGQESTGMMIRFNALSEVVNPSLLNVNTYEELKLNFTMQPGDVIEISTYRGKRSIILTRNNVETNIFNSLAFETSTFLQLEVGDNLFRYDADEGLDYLEVSMTYTPRQIGV